MAPGPGWDKEWERILQQEGKRHMGRQGEKEAVMLSFILNRQIPGQSSEDSGSAGGGKNNKGVCCESVKAPFDHLSLC